MSMQFKAKAKRWIGFLMAALLVCNLIPASIFATSSSEYASRVAYPGGTKYYDAEGKFIENGNDNSDYAVKISKTAEQGDKEHEFDITLTVTPRDKEVEIKKKSVPILSLFSTCPPVWIIPQTIIHLVIAHGNSKKPGGLH